MTDRHSAATHTECSPINFRTSSQVGEGALQDVSLLELHNRSDFHADLFSRPSML